MSLNKRLQRLEANRPQEREYIPELDQVINHLEEIAEIAPGSLPRTTEAAAAMGYQSMADATAAALGMTMQELKGWLRNENITFQS